MKTRTYRQVAIAKERAERFAADVLQNNDRAADFADMSIEDYADERGIEIQNPTRGKKTMSVNTIQTLRNQLKEANARIEELEEERAQVLDAMGIEVLDEDDEDDTDEESDED